MNFDERYSKLSVLIVFKRLYTIIVLLVYTLLVVDLLIFVEHV